MANFDFPGTSPIADDKGTITGPWLNVFSRWQNINAAAQQSGTTAQRPTSLLWIGRRFYDTTLGYPVWVHSVTGGVVVWHNAAGLPV